ncbi:very-long-chain 3-oxoacyl-CoA reductase-A [Corythoichthys intestinalis]|uniref:very-long-chain 3-oxoacyl-CoA reductase-A n=1 Tax=Corythoichthys intestinalis TaxID=161448 RepID=UPI0025A5CEA0|nr:very-long-chain 3-oxoacyl-CoA reductase-A [Corythoichthys intestinalis]XP_061813099.1 very-long-chain 3-oxoacyl-CoA reductase-A [Nerophis lumbriciformis]
MTWTEVQDTLRGAETPLFWVGAFVVASLFLWIIYRLVSGFIVWVLGNGQLISPRLGKWAVVTGATDGIGKSYAEELARRGFAIVLISRSQHKLDDVARSLEDQFGVETKIIVADFGKTNIYPSIEAGLSGLEIGVLVNNVGVSYPYPEYYLHIPDLDNFITNMINVNMTSVCQMTRLVLPRMADRSKGVILNISSASGMYPLPLLTIYSATKAFVDFFSRGLQEEYRRQGIIIQSVLPFFVATKMTRIRKPTLDKPTPERYVSAELNTVGLQSQTNGYFPHAVMGWVTTKLVPISIVIFLGARMNRLQRTGYLNRRKLREQKNGTGLKTD